MNPKSQRLNNGGPREHWKDALQREVLPLGTICLYNTKLLFWGGKKYFIAVVTLRLMFAYILYNTINKIQFFSEVEHLQGTGKHTHETLSGQPAYRLSVDAHHMSLLSLPIDDLHNCYFC